MSFERTKGSIENLSGKSEISLDLMLDMLVCVSQDVLVFNGVNDAKDMAVIDQGLLLKKEYNLVRMLLSAYEANKSGISDFGSSLQDRYDQAIKELEKVLAEISGLIAEIDKEEAKKAELAEKHKKLNDERAHVLHLKDECDDLQKKIEILSDPKLDEMASIKDSLQEELDERKLKHQELCEQQTSIQSAINDFKERILNLNNLITELQNQTKSLKEDEDLKLREKSALEQEIENRKRGLIEYQKWIADYPAMHEELTNNYEEHNARFTVMLNACNSVKSDEFIMKTLFRIPGTEDALSIDNYPDFNVVDSKITNINELAQWFDAVGKRIKGLLDVYGKMLESLVKQAESITSDNE